MIRKCKDGAVDGRCAKRNERVRAAVRMLRRAQGATVDELMAALTCSRRTIYHVMYDCPGAGWLVVRHGFGRAARYHATRL